MTNDLTGVRTNISNVIDELGSAIIITPLIITVDKWGDKLEATGIPVNTVGIPLNYIVFKYNFQKPGDLQEGESVVVIKYDETVYIINSDTRYKVEIDSVEYDVVRIEDYDVADITLAKKLIIKKRQ